MKCLRNNHHEKSLNENEKQEEAERPQTGNSFITNAFQLVLLGNQQQQRRSVTNKSALIQQRRDRVRKRGARVEEVCLFTFTQLCEDQELGLSGVRLLLADGGSRAELHHVGVTRQLFLRSQQVKG